jgi:urea transporter/murein DD-endopeptidase MepM/ murein hydrolase activator NlpD
MKIPRWWSELSDGFFRSYGEVLFSQARLVGLAFVVATAIDPPTAVFGMLAVIIGLVTTRALNFSDEANRHGLFGYNALLVGLAIGAAFQPTAASLVLLIGASITTVVVTASVRSVFGFFNLPALSLPFLLVILAVLAAAPTLGISYSYEAFQLGHSYWGLPVLVSDFLVTLGSVFFVPHPLAGLVVLAGLLSFSRIATLLALVGYVLAFAIGAAVANVIPPEQQLFLTISTVVVAIAIGGIWFVPGLSSMLLVIGSVVVSAIFAIANYALLRSVGYPVLFLPLNLTIWAVLFAMRQRMRDAQPKAVDLVGGTPEQNLAHFRNRVARFGAHYAIRFRAPFLGRWVCTQSSDGELTHQGHWRHALDFQVLGPDGRISTGDGTRVEDYRCYGLPIVAPADGTVVRVESDVPDNPVGEVNLRENWGNHVLLHHGGGIFSLCAHLKPGDSNVWEGKTVRRGDEIGHCGNSGRSPVPHLHFQLQSSAVVGAPTIVTELHDVIVHTEHGDALSGTIVPSKDTELRNVQSDLDISNLLGLHRESLTFCSDDGRVETIEAGVDMLNRRVIRSDSGAELIYDLDDIVFTVHEVTGSPRSMLHLIRLALGRVPLEVEPSLLWHDQVPRDYTRSRTLRWVLDFASPFMPHNGIRMAYRGHVARGELLVLGASVSDQGSALQTIARLDAHGIRTLAVVVKGRSRSVERVDADLPSRIDVVESTSRAALRAPARTTPKPEIRS